MFCILKKIYIYPAYVSKHNKNCDKQVILLMISNGEIRDARSEGREAKSERRVVKGNRPYPNCHAKLHLDVFLKTHPPNPQNVERDNTK